MNPLWQDIRYGLRILIKHPGFTIVAVMTLALGIGANTALFSVVNAVLLRPLPYPEPDRLVTIRENIPLQSNDQIEASYPNFLDWRDQSRSFEQMVAYRFAQLTLTGRDEPARVQSVFVSADFFKTLGVAPEIGRVFLDEETQPGSQQVVIVSHGFWQQRFGGDPGMIGQTITLNDAIATVIGIMPASFRFPDPDVELWLPLGLVTNHPLMRNRSVHILEAIARLKPEATLEQARTEMNAIVARIQQQNPGTDPGHGVVLVPLHQHLVAEVRTALWTLLGAIGFVLLIACTNIGNLLLARSARRNREMAIRAALGAGRSRLMRQLLTEGLLLALLGGIMGLLLAAWGIDLLKTVLPDHIPRTKEIGLDGPVLAFTLTISLMTGIVFGLMPAMRSSKLDLNRSLKESGGQSTDPSGRHVGSLLVIAEIALSLVLLLGAGLMIKSFWRLTSTDPGFRPDNLLTMRVSLPNSKYPETRQVISFFQQLPPRLQSLPGIESVSAVNSLPISGGDSEGQLTIEGRPFPPGEAPGASYRRVLPNYFATMGIPLRQGREFDERDRGEETSVVIINAEMARRYWPDESPIGQRIKVGPPENEPWLTIVGVIGDVRNTGLADEPQLATYEPHPQRPWSIMNLAVRTAGDPLSFVGMIRGELRAMEKDLLIDQINTMDERITDSVAERRFNMMMMAIFAAGALLLASAGIYGVMSYAVAQRNREIGVRIALGAQAGDVLKLVVGQGMKPVVIGVIVGLAAALMLLRIMTSLLFEVSAADPATFVTITLFLTGVALLACYLPARRATKVDPMEALRYE